MKVEITEKGKRMLNMIKNKIEENIMISGEEARKNYMDYHKKQSDVPKMFIDAWSKKIREVSKKGGTNIETSTIRVNGDKVLWFNDGSGNRLRVGSYDVTLDMLTKPFAHRGFDVEVIYFDYKQPCGEKSCYLKIKWVD